MAFKSWFLSRIFILFVCFAFCSNSMQDRKSIVEGNIADSLTGMPLHLANIMIKGYTKGATTDLKGYFRIEHEPTPTDSIVVSFIGYKTRTIAIVDVQLASIMLAKQENLLPEIVVFSPGNGKQSTFHEFNKFKPKDCFVRYQPADSDGKYYIPTRPKEPSIEAKYFIVNSSNDDLKFVTEIRILLTKFNNQATCRLRVFSNDNYGLPGADIEITDNILQVNQTCDLVVVNLKENPILIPDNGIFVGIELLLTENNLSQIPIPDDSGHIDIFSPFLMFYESTMDSIFFIYSSGSWKKVTQMSSLTMERRRAPKYLQPAISLSVATVKK